MSIQSRAFLKLFRDEVQSALAESGNFMRLWNSARDWTGLMLGTGTSRASAGFGVLGNIGRNLGYQLQAEYLRVDQIWYTTSPETPNDWRIEAFIEHENDVGRLPETIRKLLELGPGFKVAIVYPDPSEKKDALAEITRLIENRYGTPADSRVSVVFGFLDEGKAGVLWEAFEFDGVGRVSVAAVQKQSR
jgi:hypothetical protein